VEKVPFANIITCGMYMFRLLSTSFHPLECQSCFMCNKPGSCVCNDCTDDPSLQGCEKLYFCDKCSFLWHNHPNRQDHRPHELKLTGIGDDFDTGRLQLLSVLCIETSHYVCFTRVTENDWVFFDSMAERLGMLFLHTGFSVLAWTLNQYSIQIKFLVTRCEVAVILKSHTAAICPQWRI